MAVLKRLDASAWVGMWPFTANTPTSLPELRKALTAVGISGAAVSPVNSILAPEPMGATMALLDDAQRLVEDDFCFRVVPVINPSLRGWEHDLETLLSKRESLIGAIKILPNYHIYSIEDTEAVALTRAVTDAGLGLCVQVRMLDERSHHPLMAVPSVRLEKIAHLAKTVPQARILACGVFQAELNTIVGSLNVSVELSSIESADSLGNALTAMGEDRVLLGSHAPIYYPAVAVAKISNTTRDDAIINRITSTNATIFFRWPLPSNHFHLSRAP
jgi:hypothetical protein